MRAVFRVLFGLILACLAAGLIQVMFVVTPADVVKTDAALIPDRLGSAGFLALLAATQTAVFAVPFAIVAAIIGEWQGIRSWIYYALAGLAIAMAGFLTQYSNEGGGATIVNDYAFRAFLTTGFFAGFVYWMVSGRSAGAGADGIETSATKR